jgi:hypothetical protein
MRLEADQVEVETAEFQVPQLTAKQIAKSSMQTCSRSSVLTSATRSRCRYSARRAAIALRRTQACDLYHWRPESNTCFRSWPSRNSSCAGLRGP